MIGIILEGVLFVALLATVAALLFYALLRWTPLGLRLGRTRTGARSRRRSSSSARSTGLQREEEMVRLPSGSRICPTCYKEAYMSSAVGDAAGTRRGSSRLAARWRWG